MVEDSLGSPRNTGGRYAPYKSWGEHRIGQLLDKYGLPFTYEKPTAVLDGGKVRLWYPDFTLSYGPVIEYFGVNGNDEYRKRTEYKLIAYEQNQIEALPLYPRDLSGPWESRLLGRIDHALERRLAHYRTRAAGGYQRPLRPSGQSYGDVR